MRRSGPPRRSKPPARAWIRRVIRWGILILIGVHLLWATALAGLRFINPVTTGVQLQRQLEAILTLSKYHQVRKQLPLSQISPDLQHAVIAAEDGRFYEHHGIDWKQVRKVAEESRESGEISRGASTITQQLVKNLFFTTHRNPIRKVCEYTLAPMADFILGKQRVLELYLNNVEWGPGIFGAEAAAQFHYHVPASKLSREQAARLSAILPSPRRRKPGRMNQYSAAIQTRMRQLGW